MYPPELIRADAKRRAREAASEVSSITDAPCSLMMIAGMQLIDTLPLDRFNLLLVSSHATEAAAMVRCNFRLL